ncbi:MAG: PLP-dependent aminotransferase family protein [Clostridia bacterium]|nr:PLP-dependent aminotransferase family protein [Clostridia bacterium]
MKELRMAERMEKMSGSAVREILKLTQQPNMISFAGGLPSPDSFPVAKLQEITNEVYSKSGAQMLQYGITEGYKPLNEFIAQWLKSSKNITASPEDIQITSGSQQGIDLVSRVFLNAGDQVVVESPSYLSAFQVFNSYQVKYLPIPSDDQGMQVDELEKALDDNTNKPKLVYTVATFQNPTGITMSLERRKKLLQLADKHKLIIIEDNPYGELRYEGEHVPTLKSLDTQGRVVYLGSFSKVVAPGLRIGYAVAHPEIRAKITIAKQAADVHSSNLSQQIIYEYCNRGYLDPHIQEICRAYGVKRDAMFKALDEHFPKAVNWTRPEGGLFIWAELPQGCDTTELLQKAVEHRVAFVPGTPFFVNNTGQNTLRLNFSNATFEQIEYGIAKIGEVIKEYLTVNC